MLPRLEFRTMQWGLSHASYPIFDRSTSVMWTLARSWMRQPSNIAEPIEIWIQPSPNAYWRSASNFRPLSNNIKLWTRRRKRVVNRQPTSPFPFPRCRRPRRFRQAKFTNAAAYFWCGSACQKRWGNVDISPIVTADWTNSEHIGARSG